MFDLVALIQAAGYLGLFAIIFAESGLLIGFFFPGDSLLFTAGFLASQSYLNIWALTVLSFSGAVLGNSFGYYFGKKVGPRIFTREDSLIFSKHHLRSAEEFYIKHGAKTIVLARFLPIIRTFAPIVAGIGRMRYPIFLFYTIIGGFLWGVCLPALGFFLGNAVPNIDRYLLPIIAFIILLSFLPTLTHVVRNKSDREKIAGYLRKIWDKIIR